MEFTLNVVVRELTIATLKDFRTILELQGCHGMISHFKSKSKVNDVDPRLFIILNQN